ncbi:hypothetical protein C3486_00135 [Streptomyces sp. Ru73]|uniref:hypothetical protein n=1 Tax=Streptomyces TaxID=1883 RepID=UPI0004C9BFF6|nr:hypothetical protein [Streptomyces sp. Ru73]POX43379.1 hypothetical protein C3486_00135 [Streptomyces sp. Ru73]
MPDNARGGASAALPADAPCAGIRQQHLAELLADMARGTYTVMRAFSRLDGGEPHYLKPAAGEMRPAVEQHAVAARGR